MSEIATRNRYTTEDVERGLLVLALNGGRPQRASEQLAAQFGKHVPDTTLCKWRDHTHRDRYLKIASEQESKVREAVAAQCEQVVFAATEIELEALEHFRTAMAKGDIPSRELPSAIRNITTSKGINFDKAAAARDRPAAVVEIRGSDELYAAMKGLGLEVIEGEAEDISEAKVVSSLPAT